VTVTRAPRKTRFRLAANLGRTGLDPQDLFGKFPSDSSHVISSPFPELCSAHATLTFVELSIAGRNPRIESIESSFEFRVAALEAETFAEPQSDRIAVLPEEFCDITSSEAIADQGKGDELDSSSDLIRLPISRCEIVETVRGGGLESGRELRELELEPLFGEPAPVEQSCGRVTTEIGDLVDTSDRYQARGALLTPEPVGYRAACDDCVFS